MINSELNDRLHNVVKKLHNLNIFASSNMKDYEALLKSAIKDIFQLLNYFDKLYTTLELKVNQLTADFGSLDILCYMDKPSTALYHKDLDILQFIQSYQNLNQDSTTNVLESLVKLLSNINDKKPTRIKDTYTIVLVKFSELLNFFIKLHQESEMHLVKYLSKCFSYESVYFLELQKQLENNWNIKEEDTEKIVNYLDSIISGNDEKMTQAKDDDSIFSYDTSSFPHKTDKIPLEFKSNDVTFNKLYAFFLHILRLKNPNAEDFKEYIKIMINLYKKHNGITCIEVNSFKFKELKLNYFYNFLMGDENKEGAILPRQFQETNERIISETVLFPEMSIDNKYGVPKNDKNFFESNRQEVSSRADIPVSQDSNISLNSQVFQSVHTSQNLMDDVYDYRYSIEDQSKLIGNLKHIIPLLNEFGLDFDLRYPQIFRMYISLLYNEFGEEAKAFDFDYINDVVKIINCIIDFENEDFTSNEIDIKGSVIEFHRLHTFLCGNQKTGNFTLLMRLALQMSSKSYKTKMKVLKDWNLKALAISQLEYNYNFYWKDVTEVVLKRRILKKWFNRSLKIKNLQAETTKYNKKVLLSRYFTSMWLKRTTKNINSLEKSDVAFLSRYLIIWRNQSKAQTDLFDSALTYYKNSLIRPYFKLLYSKYKVILNSERNAIKFSDLSLEKNNAKLQYLIWTIWFNKMNKKIINLESQDSSSYIYLPQTSTLSQKLSTLAETENKFTKMKYLKIWRAKGTLKSTFNSVKMKNNVIFLKFIFEEEWLKKTRLKLIGKDVLHSKNLKIKLGLFKSWHRLCKSRSNANDFSQKRILKSAFNLWKLRTLLGLCNRNIISESLNFKLSKQKLYFKTWILSQKLKTQKNQISLQIKAKFHGQWKSRLLKAKQEQRIAFLRYNSQLAKNYLIKWVFNFKYMQELCITSDLNVQRKFLNKILNRYHYQKIELNKMGDEYLTHSNLNNKIMLLAIMTKWQQVYEINVQTQLESRVQYFKQKVVEPNNLKKFLIKWVSHYNGQQSLNYELDSRSDRFLKTTVLKKILMNKWISSVRSKLELAMRADLFELALLFKKFLIIWYDQFVEKNVHLNQIANDFIDQKEFQKVSEIINNWTMKHVKIFRRNEEICESFINKWQSSKLRTILELWVYKMKEVQYANLSVRGQSLHEADLSIPSNPSPLAKKSTSYLEHETSYLYTPLKSQVKMRFATPASPSVSPTKLQETTQRMKTEKISALRKHFAKARNISIPNKSLFSSTPIRKLSETDPFEKESFVSMRRISGPHLASVSTTEPKKLKESQFVKLSPPRASSYNAFISPNPPNFDIANSLNNAATSSSEILSPSEADLKDEKSLIETAKKLRRITPIIFPTEDIENEPRFSPVNKLKERLRNNIINISPTREDAAIF